MCNASVNFVMAHDSTCQFRFASLQSDAAKELLASLGHTPDEYQSVVLIQGTRIATASTAALLIARRLSLPWSLISVFLIVPHGIRDIVYRFIARNRYKWFGRRSTCRIPTEAERSRFL